MKYAINLNPYQLVFNNPKGLERTRSHNKREIFAYAVVLARKGRYQEALEILSRPDDSNDFYTTEKLELIAKIYAQQGLFIKAEQCWIKLLHKDGSNVVYKRALERLKRKRKRKSVVPYVIFISFISIAFSIFGVLYWQLSQNNQIANIENKYSNFEKKLQDTQLREVTKNNEINSETQKKFKELEALKTQVQFISAQIKDLSIIKSEVVMTVSSDPTINNQNTDFNSKSKIKEDTVDNSLDNSSQDINNNSSSSFDVSLP